ncbi:MAG: hypothetical protein WDN69_09380 [Aliidongia sp.]
MPESADALPLAKTDLGGFGGAALIVSPTGIVRHANEPGASLMAELSDETIYEISEAAGRAMAADAMRLERLNGPFPGECADAVVLPLIGQARCAGRDRDQPGRECAAPALIESRPALSAT